MLRLILRRSGSGRDNPRAAMKSLDADPDMFDGKSSDDPNPFAFATHASGTPRGKALQASLKFLLLVVVALSITVVLGSQSRRWLVNRITRDFGTLSQAEKMHRLSQLDAFDATAIESLVGILCDDEDSVARAAYEMLRTQQNEWNVLERRVAIKHHLALVNAMDTVVHQINDDRTMWTTGLLQQSISACVNRQDAASARLYEAATAMLDRMTLSERSGPSILVDGSDGFEDPRRLTIRTEPLPVPASESVEDWTQWPPVDHSPPTIYRSSAGSLQPVTPGEDVSLGDVNAPQSDTQTVETKLAPLEQPASQVATNVPDIESEVRPVAMLVDSPLETFDVKSVIHWLGHSHEPLRMAAKAELTRRGLSEDEIGIATRIAAGDVQTKLDLVDSIARSGSLDPRPWLLLLMSDPSRDVKLKTVSVLATINDPAVEQELRNHIIDEPDPTVAFRIRRLLDLR